ncbi:hypothetical protein [Natronobacterium gregoryi]|uniref:MFS transporter n=2 Tax=Natronobacterium gregoryi TaxID=44930 RepID=L0AJQ2_NATGS|nr:hypothetical protein [Natronobacterium gregoryi]AFZ73664.1 hypothetical protein Natgr_2500 [Natronobacterium gregoryi SP2]ELY67858.1 major facilitator family transporter [Natronobacterium gregoryi SP2]PLK19611.1 MFS transporter [Natronobacterium gregoryi SP2]SFJ00549.1 hypothetical protein SAMN05443661_11129 [Natronobacterium gregoryi]
MVSASIGAALEEFRSPRVALLANVALVMTGSVLALVGYLDLVTGVVVVTVGLLGIAVSLVGHGSTERDDGHHRDESGDG